MGGMAKKMGSIFLNVKVKEIGEKNESNPLHALQ
jgi:hypothetical protein